MSNERYDEVLILVDGSKTRTIRSRGPIQDEKSKAAIDTIRLYVGESTEDSKDEQTTKTVESR